MEQKLNFILRLLCNLLKVQKPLNLKQNNQLLMPTKKYFYFSHSIGQIIFSHDLGQIIFSHSSGQIIFSHDLGQIKFSHDLGQIIFSHSSGQIIFSHDSGQIIFSHDLGQIIFSHDLGQIIFSTPGPVPHLPHFYLLFNFFNVKNEFILYKIKTSRTYENIWSWCC